MPVPYLDNPPDVIPIDVGRQLFVDDFLIADTTLERTFHAARMHPSNPVLDVPSYSGGLWSPTAASSRTSWETTSSNRVGAVSHQSRVACCRPAITMSRAGRAVR